MQEAKWVKAEDLAVNDEIRFVEPIWDVDRGKYSSRYREIRGTIVKLGPAQLTLSTGEGVVRKRITTIEKFETERLDRDGSGREPKVRVTKRQKWRDRYDPLDDEMMQAIDRDDAYYRRIERQNQS